MYNTCIGIIGHKYNAEFRRQRKLSLWILKEFGFGKDIIEERIQTEVSILLHKIREIKSAAFCPDILVTSRTLSVIGSILFGRHMDDEELCELCAVCDSFMQSMEGFAHADAFPLCRFLPIMRRIEVFASLYNQLFRIVTNNVEQSDDDSFVRYYMNNEGSNLDREQLEHIVRDLIIGGTETSASTLLWSLVLLAGRDGQSAQEHMWKEIDSQVPHDRLPSLADRPHLPFVEATILEIMRIRTVLPVALPHQTCRDTTVGGYFIPANTMASNSVELFFITSLFFVMFVIFAVHSRQFN